MKRKIPVIILECANSHDGNYRILTKTIEKFSKFDYEGIHIKFQPISANTLSTPDYNWFNVYKKLEFNHVQWKKMINKAYNLYKGVWIDIFDEFGIKILKENIKKLHGIKIQASTLENKKVIYQLKKIDLKKKIILNVSGKKIPEIKKIISTFENISKDIILQSGYQDYPTELKETNFNKILILKKKFPNKVLSYADHLDSMDLKSIFLPIKAYQFHCDIIEKHIALRGKKSKFDNFSSLNINQTNEMFKNISFFFQNDRKSFLSKKEKKYLNNIIQLPVAKDPISKGNLVDINKISYLRTNHNQNKIYNFDFKKNYIAKKKIKKFEIINYQNVKHLKIGLFIACRLKSSRLKNKAILKLTNKHTLIEKCILSSKKIKSADIIAITTSKNSEDFILNKFCKKHKIEFFQGSGDNVVKRYLDAAKKFKIDVIIRVTGDCPEISSEIVEILLKSFSKTNADYTVAKNCPIGFGAEIIKVSALRSIFEKKPDLSMSEYMTYYFTNNRNIFKLNFVKLPKFMTKKYRMTIDYSKDLEFFRELYKCFEEEEKEFNFKNLNFIMKKYHYINKINSKLELSYKSDENLINKISKASKIF